MAFPADPPLTVTAVLTAAASIALASLVWWRRLSRLERMRRRVSAIRALSREAARGPDAASIALTIQESLRRTLGDAELRAVISQPGDSAQAGAGPQNRLEFPLDPEDKLRGFVLIRHSREEGLPEEIHEALGDLALHAGIALEMREQRRLKEQVVRGEQLAASSLLLAGIARELRPRLEGIFREARQRNLDGLAAEAEAALGLVERLAAFGERELARPTVFDLSDVLRELGDLRRHAWRLMQVDVQMAAPDRPVPVRAPRGLVEEAVLGLIVAAEQALGGGPSARLALAVETRGGRAVLSLALGAPPALAATAPASVSACRSLLESCGGGLEWSHAGGQLRFEIVLPLAAQDPPRQSRQQPALPARQLTLLLVHPEAGALRPLIRALAERNHRVVPAADSLQALEMTARMRFDAVFASPAQPDLEWPEFAARIRQHVPAVGWLSTTSRPAPPGVLSLPLHPSERFLEDHLAALEGTAPPPHSSIPS
jgi:hypothetical protein